MSLGSPSGPAEPIERDVVSFARRDGRYCRRHAIAWTPALEYLFVRPPRGRRQTSIDPTWQFDARTCFGRRAPLVVEIGSGTGDAALAHAAAHPQWDHLAVEVYRPGLARLVSRAHRQKLTNLRVCEGDGRSLLAHNLPAGSVQELHVWFPDPWPKTRHHKRRLIDVQFFTDAARVLAPGGVLRVATDWADYAHSIAIAAEQASQAGVFTAGQTAPVAQPGVPQKPSPSRHLGAPVAGELFGAGQRYELRPITRFEAKGRQFGRGIVDFTLYRP